MNDLGSATPNDLIAIYDLLFAIHEAGHAVIAERLRVPYDFVTIDQLTAKDGTVLGGHLKLKEIDPTTDALSKLALIGERVAVSFAGELAEERFGFPLSPHRYVIDEQYRVDLIEALRGVSPNIEIWIAQTRMRISNILSDPLEALTVSNVATFLRERRTLQAGEVAEIVSQTARLDPEFVKRWARGLEETP